MNKPEHIIKMFSEGFPESDDIRLIDAIPIEKLQSFQDNFSISNGVSSIISDLTGQPITQPNAVTAKRGKLSEASAPIYIGEKHVADWKIEMCGFGGMITPFVEAVCENVEKYDEIQEKLSDKLKEHFDSVCNLLKVFVEEISEIGNNNIRLAHELIKRKEHETKLAEDEDTFRSIFDNAIDGIILIGKDGMVKEWSQGKEILTGITREEAIGHHVWEALTWQLSSNTYTDEEREQMCDRLNEVFLHKERATTTRNIVNRKTRQELIVQTVYFPVHLHGEEMLGSISRDVTKEVNNERELTAEKERLETLSDNLPEGTLYRLVLNRDTGKSYMEYVSASWERVTGLTPESVAEDLTPFFDIVHPDDKQYYWDSSNASIIQQSNFYAEIRISRKGEMRWVQISSRPFVSRNRVVWDGIMMDITRRKEAERQLETEKERLKAIGDNLPYGTLYQTVLDNQTGQIRLTYVSASWEEVTKIPADVALADIEKVFEVVHPDDLLIFKGKKAESIRTLNTYNCEVRIFVPDLRWVQVTARPRIEGLLVIWDGLIFDITERKNTELKLETYRSDLERAVKERTEELEATNEELYATNEELYATNEELNLKNDQIQHEMLVRKEMIQKLEDSENKLRNFIEQSFEGIIILDHEGKVIEWNPKQEVITEIPRKEALGKYAWELYQRLVPEEEAFILVKQFHEQILSLLNPDNMETISRETEHVIHTPSKEERYCNMTSFKIAVADKCYVGEIVRDTTERKMLDMELELYRTQLEEMVVSQTKELIEGKERLTSLSDNLPGGVIYQMCGKRGQALQFNYISARFTSMFHIPVDDAIEDSSLFFRLLYPEDGEEFINMLTSSKQQGFVDKECRILLDTGETKWLHMRSSFQMQDDETQIWDGFMVDITDSKIAMQELEEMRLRQDVLIKALQIVQTAENIPEAINRVLEETGKYAGVSRCYIFEKSTDGKTVDNTYEWCNEGITPEIDNLQGLPSYELRTWFDFFAKGEYVCTSDIATLAPEVYEILEPQDIKSILVLPLEANGVSFGFIGFDECLRHKDWQQKEVDLLISLSRVIASTTRRFQAEKAMQLSQQTMRTVLDNINANIYVADFDTYELLFVNKMMKDQIEGAVEGEICWKVLQKGMTGPCDFCPNFRLLDEGKKPTGLYRSETQNTMLSRWFECADAAIEWIDGRLVHMEYATDITDRRTAEEALRQSEEQYRQLTVASPDAIVVCDPQGKIIFISPRAKELFLINDDKKIGNVRVFNYVHPHDLQKAFEIFRALPEDIVSFLPQLLLMREDGSDFFGEISAAAVKDDKGQVTSSIMVIRDITERKISEMELIRAKEKAEESDNLKSAFLANMSHEIRTPINGIIGFLNFLADDNLSPKRRHEYITVVNNSSTQLVKLIDDIIDVAKIEAKQMNIRPVSFHLNEFMQELQVFFDTYLQANHKDKIALILDDSGFIDPCVIFVDPMRLRQVLSNLIGNAIKFTEKGFIGFGYRLLPPDKLEFWVEDSGIGLAADQLEVIFERFRQAELTNSRRYGGTGLGLTISRSLVQMMGGDISVESVEEEGSTFRFTTSYLPIAPEDESIFDENITEKTADQPFEGMSILVVEPEVMTYRYYEKLLTSTGASPIQAYTVKQWLDTISQQKDIDVVLANASVFKNEDEEALREVKSVRAGLPLVLIVPERNGYYDRIINDSQCNWVIEGVANHAMLYDALKKYV